MSESLNYVPKCDLTSNLSEWYLYHTSLQLNYIFYFFRLLKFIICLSLGCGLPQYSKDKFCEDENNNAACNFDGGACCGANVIKTYCTKCQCLQGGSGGGSGEGPI